MGELTGSVLRVDGPLVESEGPADAAMHDVVRVGPGGIAAEVIGIAGTVLTVQAYEYTGGIRVGDPVRSTGGPLSARLGPSLLGEAYDGLLRPLSNAPDRLDASVDTSIADSGSWAWTPRAKAGTEVGPGDLVGIVPGVLEHRVLVPPGLTGTLNRVRPAGEVGGDEWVAEIDGVEVTLHEFWPIRHPRPFQAREDAVLPLHTGQRVLDLLFPLARGATAAVPGGFGTGKTVLLQQIAKWCDADVIVYVGCGERGNEMAEALDDLAALADPRTGGRLIDRTVVIANTSNMPMMARESSLYTGITVAEYYRDMGYDTVVIADSTSRWAEALREFASRAGELPAEEGYPANLSSALAAFYERAGRVRTLGGATGSVTVIGAVSPPGGDLTEPVTTATLRFVQSVWSLDRDLAYSRHYPAVTWSGSFAGQAAGIGDHHARNGDPAWRERRDRTADLLTEADRLADLAEIVGSDTLPDREQAVLIAARLIREGLLMQSALDANDDNCPAGKASALHTFVLSVAETCVRLAGEGVGIETLRSYDFGPVLRARSELAPNDVEAIRQREKEVVRDLEVLR